jgi:hypothetical protein
MLYFDERLVSPKYDWLIEHNVLRWRRNRLTFRSAWSAPLEATARRSSAEGKCAGTAEHGSRISN